MACLPCAIPRINQLPKRPAKTTRLARLLTGLLFLLSVACLAEIRVSDDLGREVVLQRPAQRIVSLAPHNTENLFTAGAGDLVVGTVEHSDYPQPALAIPLVGNYTRINIEAVLALKPDLVIAWAGGNPEEPLRRLAQFGIPVFYSEPTNFERIISNIERFSMLSGRQEAALQHIAAMKQLYRQLKDQYSGKPPVRVFYQVWNRPLITLNGQHSVSRAIELCSGENVFADEPTIAPKINIEGVIARNPQLILLAGHDNSQASNWITQWMQWPAIDAVTHRQVRQIDADIVNRPTRRFLEGTREMCELIDGARHQLMEKPASTVTSR